MEFPNQNMSLSFSSALTLSLIVARSISYMLKAYAPRLYIRFYYIIATLLSTMFLYCIFLLQTLYKVVFVVHPFAALYYIFIVFNTNF
jgi:hypothetical protein